MRDHQYHLQEILKAWNEATTYTLSIDLYDALVAAQEFTNKENN